MNKDLKFMTFGREAIPDLHEHVATFLKEDPHSIVAVGTDSKQLRHHTMYAIAVVIYNPLIGRGAHVVFCRFKVDKQRDMFMRLYKEAEYSLDVAESLHAHLVGKYVRKDLKDNEKHLKLVDIHLDFNPAAGPNGAWKSFSVYNATYPWLKGQDFRVFSKPSAQSFAASCCADLLMKKRRG